MKDAARNLRCRLAELSRPRRDVYAFLGAAFLAPPTAESLRALTNADFIEAAEELFGVALDSVRHYKESAEQTPELQREARQQYMNLFKVPGGQYITPYQSVFSDARDVGGKFVKGLLMGQPAAFVQKWYQLAAVEIAEEYKDLPDHIGLELNFLAHLCTKELEFADHEEQARLTRTWEMERDFLSAHVVSWAPQLRDRMYEKTQHAFFRATADLLVEFTRRDLVTLEGVVGASSGKPLPEYGPIGPRHRAAPLPSSSDLTE